MLIAAIFFVAGIVLGIVGLRVLHTTEVSAAVHPGSKKR
jgi:hypothetical protein